MSIADAAPTFYATPGHAASEVVGKAFTEGCGGEYAETRFIRSGGAAFYGVSKYTAGIHNAARARGDYYYLDNGYLRPGHFDGYFRATHNAAQHDGTGKHGPERWRALGLTIKPWRRSGRHVLVVGHPDSLHIGCSQVTGCTFLLVEEQQDRSHLQRLHECMPRAFDVSDGENWCARPGLDHEQSFLRPAAQPVPSPS